MANSEHCTWNQRLASPVIRLFESPLQCLSRESCNLLQYQRDSRLKSDTKMYIALELESVHNSNGMVVCFCHYDPNLQRFHAEIMTKLQQRKNHRRFSQEITCVNGP